ncbi:MAG: hypothetical protein WBR09_21975 [Serratia proteamaculans]
MSSEGLPVDGVIGTDIVLKARSTQQATNDAKSNLSADSTAQSADAAFKFSKESDRHSNNSSAFADKAAASAAKNSEQNASDNAKAVVASGFSSGPLHTADALSKDNKSSIQRFTNATVNRPANGTGGLLTMPIDGGHSWSYFAVLIARQAWEGTSNSVNPSVAGDPMDIPDGRLIDLRLEMPMGELTEEPVPDEQPFEAAEPYCSSHLSLMIKKRS